jgi:transcriptional regulator with XRE-family HTH domain
MTSLDAVREMLGASGLSPYRVAVVLGRTPSYISGMLRRGSCPSADLLAKIADACGYSLQLVPREGGDTLTIGAGPADADGSG